MPRRVLSPPTLTPRRLDCLAFRLVLMVLVAACDGQGAGAQTAAPGGQPSIRHAAGSDGLPRDLKFTHLTTKDGLAQNNVVSILQDRQGFMWFGTGEGLDRYDGYDFIHYQTHANDPRTLSNNVIWALYQDREGYLWVGTDGGGLNRFDPTTETFTRYLPDP